VIIITAFSDLDSAVSAFQGGAFEYLAKPFDVDKAVELIRRALDESLRETDIEQGAAQTPKSSARRRPCRTCSAPSAACRNQCHGAHHRRIRFRQGAGGARAAQAQPAPASLSWPQHRGHPQGLAGIELFGHERGAFTGAQAMRRGRFEQAEGGTLFLDEIGDMPLDLQTRLLRVLSDGHFYRVGGHQSLKANVRVIAATHQNLEQRVREGLFREDLYHRLNVIRLRLPRCASAAKTFPSWPATSWRRARQLGVEAKRLSPQAMQFLSQLEFPATCASWKTCATGSP
jgi:two-component system nitrogen regulation response regulator GlnG